MGFEAKKTEHSGPKRGHGAYWGYKWEAKKESNRIRRERSRRRSFASPDPALRRPPWMAARFVSPQSASGLRYRTGFSSAEGGRFRKALAGKVQNGPYFLRRQRRKLP